MTEAREIGRYLRPPSQIVYAVQGRSESGDHYVAVFKTKPTDRQLKKLVKNWDYDDGEGPGAFGSYVHLEITEQELL